MVCAGNQHYGRLCYNNAVTIKAVEDFPVAVVCSSDSLSHLTDHQKEVFDQIIIDDTMPHNCGAKLYAYENSPFEPTLLLDVDMLWGPEKKPSELFVEMADETFACISEGDSDNPAGHYFFWAKLEEIQAKYKVTKVYQLRTEVMYFVKNDVNEAVFKDAKKIHAAPNLQTIKRFGAGVPDELAMNIAVAIHQLEIKPGFKPAFWSRLNNDVMINRGQMFREYYLLSAGGNYAPAELQRTYNDILKAQSRKIGHNPIFMLQSKYQFLKERKDS